MFKVQYRYFFLLMILAIVGCAKRGNITGGSKDTLAPVLRESVPRNFKTNFTGKEIKLYFNEYVKLKDINKQLIVSPPMDTPPEITPYNASREITIKIKDTLQPNTTYSFNFGQSIQDNNEGNPYPLFKYVFSTGSYVDSLSVSGTISDAFELKADNFVNVMLYEINEKFTDSIIYKQKPRYVTNTLDSATNFQIDNIKAGKYLLVALKDANNDFQFDPKRDKIAFYQDTITVDGRPSNYNLQLFSEALPFRALKPTQASGNRATIGYEGDPREAQFVLKNGTETLEHIITQLPEKDSLQLWFRPVKADSLHLQVAKGKFNADFHFKIKEQKSDTLTFVGKPSGTINFREQFEITASTPLVKFDTSKIKMIDKDSLAVAFTTKYDTINQKVIFDFVKKPLEKYAISILPGAFTDFFEKSNDTLAYRLTTRNTTDYGNLTVSLENVKSFPIIVELTDGKGKVLDTEYSEGNPLIVFNNIKPGKFILRIIYDVNGNRKWDPGNYLEKRQGEEVIYFPKELDVRENWDVDQPFILKSP